MRIGRIGTDHIQVSIRPALDDDELLVMVDRLERLIDAGYDAIDVVLVGGDTPDGLALAVEQIQGHLMGPHVSGAEALGPSQPQDPPHPPPRGPS